jgi:hypothetical protein
VQHTGGDHHIRAAGVTQEPCHLERMLDERSATTAAALMRVRARGELHRRSNE